MLSYHRRTAFVIMETKLFKIWDTKHKYYCMTVYSRAQAEELVRHFVEMDKNVTKEYKKNRYRIDEF